MEQCTWAVETDHVLSPFEAAVKSKQTWLAATVLAASIIVVVWMWLYRPWTSVELDIDADQLEFSPLEDSSQWFSGAYCERAVLTNFNVIESTLPARVDGIH